MVVGVQRRSFWAPNMREVNTRTHPKHDVKRNLSRNATNTSVRYSVYYGGPPPRFSCVLLKVSKKTAVPHLRSSNGHQIIVCAKMCNPYGGNTGTHASTSYNRRRITIEV